VAPSLLFFKSKLKMAEESEPVMENLLRPTISKCISTFVQDALEQLEKIEIITLEEAKDKYPNSSFLSVSTYTLHPMDGKRLTRLENFHKNLAMEKDDELIVLLGKMGAKSIRIVESNTDQKSGSAKIGLETLELGSQATTGISNKIETGRELIVNFAGSDVEIDPNLLKSSLWFSDDSRLNAIFESRCFAPNKIESYTLKNTYSETFDYDFNLAVRYLIVEVDVKAEFEKLCTKERFFDVMFGCSAS
jgi:hypothetical protein